MKITIEPRKLFGQLNIIPSKSQAHRILICAALADKESALFCPETNQDISATVRCLNALGAKIVRTDTGYHISPMTDLPDLAVMDCGESGSTLRFLLPIVGALGVTTTFIMSGKLPQRPLSPLWEEMERMGCTLSRPTENTISCSGKLRSGTYHINGGVSSQFITGLLLAAPLISGHTVLDLIGKVESLPYIRMTQNALLQFGISTKEYSVDSKQKYISPGDLTIEGDWSNGAFFLAANTLGCKIVINNLDENSCQGDREIVVCLKKLKNTCTINAADIPDLVPILSVVAAANKGARFENVSRLRLKESDRIHSIITMLNALGITAKDEGDTLLVEPGEITGGCVNAFNDHRIAMSAAIAAIVASGPVTIINAECVAKSYPTFWEEYKRLGGHYEQYLR